MDMKTILNHFATEGSFEQKLLSSKMLISMKQDKYSDFINELEAIKIKINNLLKRISPETALHWHIDQSDPLIQEIASAGLLNRFSWIVAAAASGPEGPSSKRAIEIYKLLGNYWIGLYVNSMITSTGTDDIDEWVASSAWLHRNSNQEIRFFWISKLMSETLANLVHSSPHLITTIPELNPISVKELNNELKSYIQDKRPQDRATGLHGETLKLARALSLKAGEYHHKSIDDLLSSSDYLDYPLIEFSNESIHPIAPLRCIAYLEFALIQLIERRAPGQKGEVFEALSKDCLSHFLPVTQPSLSPVFIRINKEDTGETDLALGDPIHFIGECKARFSSKYKNTSRSFVSDFTNGFKQVSRRLQAIHENGFARDFQGNIKNASELVSGMVILLQSYGSAALDNELLKALDLPKNRRVLAADLHSWILILSTLNFPDEIHEYIKFRDKLFPLGIQAADEADLLISFIGDHGKDLLRNARSVLLSDRPTLCIVRGQSISTDFALETSMPSIENKDSWKRTFYNSTFGVKI